MVLRTARIGQLLGLTSFRCIYLTRWSKLQQYKSANL